MPECRRPNGTSKDLVFDVQQGVTVNEQTAARRPDLPRSTHDGPPRLDTRPGTGRGENEKVSAHRADSRECSHRMKLTSDYPG